MILNSLKIKDIILYFTIIILFFNVFHQKKIQKFTTNDKLKKLETRLNSKKLLTDINIINNFVIKDLLEGGNSIIFIGDKKIQLSFKRMHKGWTAKQGYHGYNKIKFEAEQKSNDFDSDLFKIWSDMRKGSYGYDQILINEIDNDYSENQLVVWAPLLNSKMERNYKGHLNFNLYMATLGYGYYIKKPDQQYPDEVNYTKQIDVNDLVFLTKFKFDIKNQLGAATNIKIYDKDKKNLLGSLTNIEKPEAGIKTYEIDLNMVKTDRLVIVMKYDKEENFEPIYYRIWNVRLEGIVDYVKLDVNKLTFYNLKNNDIEKKIYKYEDYDNIDEMKKKFYTYSPVDDYISKGEVNCNLLNKICEFDSSSSSFKNCHLYNDINDLKPITKSMELKLGPSDEDLIDSVYTFRDKIWQERREKSSETGNRLATFWYNTKTDYKSWNWNQQIEAALQRPEHRDQSEPDKNRKSICKNICENISKTDDKECLEYNYELEPERPGQTYWNNSKWRKDQCNFKIKRTLNTSTVKLPYKKMRLKSNNNSHEISEDEIKFRLPSEKWNPDLKVPLTYRSEMNSKKILKINGDIYNGGTLKIDLGNDKSEEVSLDEIKVFYEKTSNKECDGLCISREQSKSCDDFCDEYGEMCNNHEEKSTMEVFGDFHGPSLCKFDLTKKSVKNKSICENICNKNKMCAGFSYDSDKKECRFEVKKVRKTDKYTRSGCDEKKNNSNSNYYKKDPYINYIVPNKKKFDDDIGEEYKVGDRVYYDFNSGINNKIKKELNSYNKDDYDMYFDNLKVNKFAIGHGIKLNNNKNAIAYTKMLNGKAYKMIQGNKKNICYDANHYPDVICNERNNKFCTLEECARICKSKYDCNFITYIKDGWANCEHQPKRTSTASGNRNMWTKQAYCKSSTRPTLRDTYFLP